MHLTYSKSHTTALQQQRQQQNCSAACSVMSNRDLTKVKQQEPGLTSVPCCSQGRMHSSRGRGRPQPGSVLQRTLKVVVPGDLLRRMER